MDELDAKIQKVLSTQDNELYGDLNHEPSFFELIGDTFHGRNRWLVVVAYVMMFVMFAGALFCGWQYFHTEETRAAMDWALGFFLLMMFVSGMKIWYWMELNKNAMLREVKRVELLIASLHKGDES